MRSGIGSAVAILLFLTGLTATARASHAAGADSRGATPALPPEKAAPVRIPRFDKPPLIDGRLDDEAWKSAAVLRDFYQVQPGDNIKPSQPTEVLLGFDSRYLYVAFRAHDSEPGKVRATVPKRDQIWDDDYVGMDLDTFNDKRRAYEIFFNPLGVQADGIFTESQGEDFSVDLVMESKGMITDDGFTVEAAIPFKSLRYEAGEGKLWGVHFFRRIKRFNSELDSWMPLSRDVSGMLSQEGHITGLVGISAERTLELIPSLTLSETGKRMRTLPASLTVNNPGLVDPGRFLNEPLHFDPGLNVKYTVTPTVILDLTLNPDFAQVEADQTVVTANQRFPIFFPEKRPFFLEGIDIFQTPLSAVHTRTIIQPAFAAKLTGKLGHDTFGLLLAADKGPGSFSKQELTDPDLLPTIARFVDKKAYAGILRLKHDVGKESNIGLLATGYSFIENHNQLAGVDGRFRIDPKTVFTFQVLGTSSRGFFFEPDQDQSIYRTGNGFAYSWNYDYSARHFGYIANGQGRTRDYRADLGFTQRTNTNNEGFFCRISSEPKPTATLISWRIFNFVAITHDWQGRTQGYNSHHEIGFNFKRDTFFNVGFSTGYERLFEWEFGPKRTATQPGAFFGDDPERSAYNRSVQIVFGTNPSKKYSAFVFTGYSFGVFDFDLGAGPRFPRVSPAALSFSSTQLDPGPGNSFDASASLAYQPTSALRASIDYTKSRLVRNDTGRVALNDNIVSVRATYQFTRFVFARARADYDSLSSRVLGQYLFGWTPSPGTAFYAGYNDDLNMNGFNPFTGQRESGFRRNGRTFFIKMSYLIRRSMGG